MDQKIDQYDIPPPNFKPNQHATNAFSHTPSPAQIVAYFILSLSIAVYFSCTLSLATQTILLILYCISGAVMLLSSAIASIINPSDRMVYLYKWSKHDPKIIFRPDLDRVLYCEHCESFCQVNSKHCRVCNRCVDNFDHHCMWFNNCVGDRNYRYFFVSVLATFSYAVVVVVHVVIGSFQVDYRDRIQLVKVVLSWTVALILAVFAFLLANLIALHIYLIATGQTTYQFLHRRKEEGQGGERDGRDKHQAHHQCKVANNKVMPMMVERPEEGTRQIIVTKAKTSAMEKEGFQQFQSKNSLNNHLKEQDHGQINVLHTDIPSHSSARKERQQAEINKKEDSLPSFLGKNRSLKLLFPDIQAQSPSKQNVRSN